MKPRLSRRIERPSALVKRVGLSRPELWRRSKAGDLPDAGADRSRAIGWYSEEINAWLASRERVTRTTAAESE